MVGLTANINTIQGLKPLQGVVLRHVKAAVIAMVNNGRFALVNGIKLPKNATGTRIYVPYNGKWYSVKAVDLLG